MRRGLDAHAGRAARLEMGDLLRPPEAYVARRNADGFERAMLETLGRVERERAAAAGGGGRGRGRGRDDEERGEGEGEGEGEGRVFTRARVAAVAHVRGSDFAGDVF